MSDVSHSMHAATPNSTYNSNRLTNWFRQMLNNRKAIAELNSLSDRDLADIGLNRSNIITVVRTKSQRGMENL